MCTRATCDAFLYYENENNKDAVRVHLQAIKVFIHLSFSVLTLTFYIDVQYGVLSRNMLDVNIKVGHTLKDRHTFY